jgi:uncharacterized membrane protein YfbV (UPF0208 family)
MLSSIPKIDPQQTFRQWGSSVEKTIHMHMKNQGLYVIGRRLSTGIRPKKAGIHRRLMQHLDQGRVNKVAACPATCQSG